MSDIWKNTKALEKLEAQRDRMRQDGRRLTFDCLKLKCKDGRAVCSMGRMLGPAKDGSMDLNTVLRGVTPGTCKTCEYYETEEE